MGQCGLSRAQYSITAEVRLKLQAQVQSTSNFNLTTKITHCRDAELRLKSRLTSHSGERKTALNTVTTLMTVMSDSSRSGPALGEENSYQTCSAGLCRVFVNCTQPQK
ncbi:hypothetical protein AOLI_G00215060 [Acnodon oligacanthus]